MRPPALLHRLRPDLLDRAPRGVRPPEPIPTTHGYRGNDSLAALLGIEYPDYNTSVTERNVIGLVAVDAAVSMVSNAVSAMMTEAQCFTATGDEIDVPTVVKRPHPLMSASEFYRNLVATAMMRGNAVAVMADWDVAGIARQLVPAHPEACSLDDSSGVPVLTINGHGYAWDEVLHVRFSAPWGSLWGRGIVERYRLPLQRHLAEAEWGRSGFMNAGVPSVHVSLDKDVVGDDEVEAVRERWRERTQGATREPIVTGRLFKIEPLSWTPEDAEWVEARNCSVAEAALMAGLNPMDLAASFGGSMSYANLTERQLARLMDSFQPWLRLVEEAMSDLLPGGSYVRGDADALLRVSTAERFANYAAGKALGIYDEDDLREFERRPKRTKPAEPPTPPEPPAAPTIEEEPDADPIDD